MSSSSSKALPMLPTPKGPLSGSTQKVYNVVTVNHPLEIFVTGVYGVDLQLLRHAYGDSWKPTLSARQNQLLAAIYERDLKERGPGMTAPNGEAWENRIQKLSGGGYEIVDDKMPLTSIHLPEMWVEMAFFYGGRPIAPNMKTRKSSTPNWNQWLRTSTNISHFPRETRVYITLWGTLPEKQTSVPLGWTAWSLFDYNGFFPSGKVQVLMKRGGAMDPMVVSPHIPDAIHPLSIQLEYPQFPLRLAFAQRDSVYSSSLLNGPRFSIVEGDDVIDVAEEDLVVLQAILKKDIFTPINQSERALVWRFRNFILNKYPNQLSQVMLACPWDNPANVRRAHKLLKVWPVLPPHEALELLASSYADMFVRSFAAKCLNLLPDSELVHYLPQLVQVLKYENYHFGPVSLFLLQRALSNRLLIGHSLIWFLLTEIDNPQIQVRYCLLVEAYVVLCGAHRDNLLTQVIMSRAMTRLCRNLAMLQSSTKKKDLLEKELQLLSESLPATFTLPVDPSIKLCGIVLHKCVVLDSNAAPLFLVFKSVDPVVEPYSVIFKYGDDLRQDMLTLQMFGIMDTLWKANGIDLGMTLYRVVATGPVSGLIEVVKNAVTPGKIQKDFGGASSAFSKRPLKSWIQKQNPTPETEKEAIDNFTRSCAGYAVATYVIGLGDRHNDNLMVTNTGHLFHIDFAHFLGNIMKFGIYTRETAPFVLTPEFVYVMGDEKGPEFEAFIQLCTEAYIIVRKHAPIFISLFLLMLSTGIPQLRQVSDIFYLRDAFSLQVSEEKARSIWRGLIFESLNNRTTNVNFFFHNLAHS